MKPIRFFFVALLALVASACGDDEPQKESPDNSSTPYDFMVTVVDNDGNNMIADKTFDVKYSDAELVYNTFVIKLGEKVNGYYFTKVGDLYSSDVRNNSLAFGLFYGDRDVTFTIDWGDGKSDVISFSVAYDRTNPGGCKRKVTVNNEPYDYVLKDSNIVITLVK